MIYDHKNGCRPNDCYWPDCKCEFAPTVTNKIKGKKETKEEQICFDIGLSIGKAIGLNKGLKIAVISVMFFEILHLIFHY